MLGLMYTLPSYKPLALQLLCTFYTFAVSAFGDFPLRVLCTTRVFGRAALFGHASQVIGCMLFARGFELQPSYATPQANFNSFMQALLTLYQMLVSLSLPLVFYAGLSLLCYSFLCTVGFPVVVILDIGGLVYCDGCCCEHG